MLVDSSHGSRRRHMGKSSRSHSLSDEPHAKRRKTESTKKTESPRKGDLEEKRDSKKRNSEKKKESTEQSRKTKQGVNDTEQDQQHEPSSAKTSVNISDLDLDVSYVGKIVPAPSIRGQRKRWSNPGPTINNQYDVPPGWDDKEPDLDPE
ncbi:hypothetical protein N7456_011832 [Penicillium angulare]|uniref:Uncharacterized protein n=1 Tax=Penicillium angulare TaxID=116970 RepID=A0A9W9K0J7_9EURO|nr:hypothetical protein N7456_011832 [Penicillium angulare]